MGVLLGCPALVKLLASLAVILILNTFRVPLVLGVITGSIVLGLWAGHGLSGLGALFLANATDAKTLLLLCLIFQVLCLSHQLSKVGAMRELVEIVDQSMSKRRAMALLPALIGLLPMPGGALFSAPMVADCDMENRVDGRLKAQINYWYRHIWEFWWPLYPGVLLAIILSDLRIQDFVLSTLPLTFFSLIGGALFFLRTIPSSKEGRTQAAPGSLTRFLVLVAPILMVPCVYAATWFLAPGWREFDGVYYFPMAMGLLVSALYLQFMRPLKATDWRGILLNKNSAMLCVLVFFLLGFGMVIKTELPGDGARTLVSAMAGELARWGIPVMLVMMMLPFLAGFTTGIAVGYVGASFPIVFALIPAHVDLAERFSTAILAYGCGYLGMMLSPIHVCFMVTAEHFKTRLVTCYGQLLGASAVVFAGVLLLSWAWGWPKV